MMTNTKPNAMPSLEDTSTSALVTRCLKDGNVGLFAQFDGQGYPQYLEDLRALYSAHAVVHSLIEVAEDALKTQLSSSEAK